MKEEELIGGFDRTEIPRDPPLDPSVKTRPVREVLKEKMRHIDPLLVREAERLLALINSGAEANEEQEKSITWILNDVTFENLYSIGALLNSFRG